MTTGVSLCKAKFVPTTKEVKFRWIISDFSKKKANLEEGQVLKSLKFPCAYNDEVFYFNLRIHPLGRPRRSEDPLAVFLDCHSEKDCKIFVELTLSLLSKEKDQYLPIRPVSAKRRIRNFNSEWSYLLNFYNEYLVNDTFAISCDIKMYYDEDPTILRKSKYVTKETTKSYFDAFNSLFEKNLFSDVTFHVQNKKIPAHKAILAARSPVFCAMLTVDMEESKTNVIEIEDFSYESVYEMVRFIYTNKVNNIEEIGIELLSAADKYGLDDLKSMCAETLTKSLEIDNAVDILLLAELHNVMELKKVAIEFINQNVADVMKTEGWKNINFTCLKDLHAALAAKHPMYTLVDQIDEKLVIREEDD